MTNVSLSFKKKLIIRQCEDIIISTCNVMRFKRLTADMIKYIWNCVICPRLTYRSQLTVLSSAACDSLMRHFRRFFKQQVGLVRSIPNVALHFRQLFGLNDLYSQQLLNRTSDASLFLNAHGTLQLVMLVVERKLQHIQ